MSKKQWIPEIYYEDAEDGVTNHIPFISVPTGESMPTMIYIFESSETGEFEPGPDGEPLPITQMDLHQYADMAVLKEKLDGPTYDLVRAAFGLAPLKEAASAGKKITEKIRQAVS